MAEKEVKQWITVNGKHVPIFEGETKSQAINRAVAKENEEIKEKQIAKNKEQVNESKPKLRSLNDALKDYSDEDIVNISYGVAELVERIYDDMDSQYHKDASKSKTSYEDWKDNRVQLENDMKDVKKLYTRLKNYNNKNGREDFIASINKALDKKTTEHLSKYSANWADALNQRRARLRKGTYSVKYGN